MAVAVREERSSVLRLAKLSDLVLEESGERVGGHAVLSDGSAVFVPLGEAIDVGRECSRLGGEVERLIRLVESQEKKLGNQQFVSRAPSDVVERERQKLISWREQYEVLVRKRELLGC
jgi:valyl-tRNA synthetase